MEILNKIPDEIEAIVLKVSPIDIINICEFVYRIKQLTEQRNNNVIQNNEIEKEMLFIINRLGCDYEVFLNWVKIEINDNFIVFNDDGEIIDKLSAIAQFANDMYEQEQYDEYPADDEAYHQSIYSNQPFEQSQHVLHPGPEGISPAIVKVIETIINLDSAGQQIVGVAIRTDEDEFLVLPDEFEKMTLEEIIKKRIFEPYLPATHVPGINDEGVVMSGQIQENKLRMLNLSEEVLVLENGNRIYPDQFIDPLKTGAENLIFRNKLGRFVELVRKGDKVYVNFFTG